MLQDLGKIILENGAYFEAGLLNTKFRGDPPRNDEYPDFISDTWEQNIDKYDLLNLKTGRITKQQLLESKKLEIHSTYNHYPSQPLPTRPLDIFVISLSSLH